MVTVKITMINYISESIQVTSRATIFVNSAFPNVKIIEVSC